MTVTPVTVLIGMVLVYIPLGGCEPLVASQAKLLKNLLQSNNYDKRILPLRDVTEPITLRLGIRLLNIDRLSESEDVLETGLHIQQIWYDYRLSWNPANFQRLHVIHIPIEELWQPDIYLFNNADARMNSMNALAIVFNTGHVFYSPKVRVRSHCQVDMRMFPYDSQECDIKIGSFTYDGQRLSLTQFQENNTLDMSDFEANKEWTVVDSSSEVITKKHSCCQEPYPYMQFRLKLQRESDYYTYVFVLPAILLASLVPFQFLVPPDSRERLTLGSLLLVASILMLSSLHGLLPGSHSNLPNIVQYYSLSIVWTVLALVNSIFIINIHTKGPRKRKVPRFVRQIFLKTLRRLVCVNDESYLPLDDVETMSFRSLEKQHTIQSESDTPESSKLERSVDEILRQVNSLASRPSQVNGQSGDMSEWYQVAVVLDRIVFILFIIIFVIYNFVLL